MSTKHYLAFLELLEEFKKLRTEAHFSYDYDDCRVIALEDIVIAMTDYFFMQNLDIKKVGSNYMNNLTTKTELLEMLEKATNEQKAQENIVEVFFDSLDDNKYLRQNSR